ncbi:MAG: hypothetical protein AVDCRST_MAG93-7416 [uncultured Chloroflexia bacterium]|uniref:Uncharacterized protein n=1 Tax=uncultured Chloroflexia bacterium TaxID=1672391 RepID=A0A6J4MDB7_9CHLR|nr:MAG: hypothetical protein AVDCRST_MAG93-7416 [uncultured Chloroflexia bacterium]
MEVSGRDWRPEEFQCHARLVFNHDGGGTIRQTTADKEDDQSAWFELINGEP